MLKAGLKLKDVPLPPLEIEEEKKVVIYGTGDVAERYFYKISEEYGEDKVAFFLEGQSIQHNFLNKNVIRPEDLDKAKMDKYVYILASFGSTSLMEGRLLAAGVQEKQIMPTMNRCNIEMLYHYEGKVEEIAIYPPIEQIEEEEEILKLLQLYVCPNDDMVGEIILFSNYDKKINNIVKIVKKQEKAITYEKYDVVLVWNPKELYNIEIAKHPCVFCFHPEVIPHLDAKILHCIAMKLVKKAERKKLEDFSKTNLTALIQGNESQRKAYVYGSGPSLTEFVETLKVKETQEGTRIVCNEFCENNEVMSVLKPQVYVLWDYGYFEDKLAFIMMKIANYMKRNNCSLVVPDTAVRMLHLRFGIGLASIIGINPYGKTMNFPTPHCMEVVRTDNVMTAFAVPLACTLADKIYMVGCDGMKDDGEWKHSESLKGKSIEYCNIEAEKMGRKRLLSKYKGVCDYYEKLFLFGEQRGKVFESLTKTYIPALKKRSKGVENEL